MRVTISDAEAFAATQSVASQLDWSVDPAASGDRIRFWRQDGREIGKAYGDGHWFVEDPAGGYACVAHGDEDSLSRAVERMLTVAAALGWQW